MPKEKKLRSAHSALHSVEGDSLQHKWWQILPLNTSIEHELRNGDKREPCIVSTPLEALERVKKTFEANFRDPGILVDTDHNSEHEAGSTRAAGWVKALEVREDGLYAQIDFTPYGLSLVGTGEYVSRSPAFTLADRGNGVYEPVELTSLALTNTPAFTTLKVASSPDKDGRYGQNGRYGLYERFKA